MEFINKVELQGYISQVSLTTIQGPPVARFSMYMYTEYAFKNNTGMAIVETTWFSCSAFEGENVDFSAIQKGNAVRVVGRLRERRYMDQEGIERRYFEVICQSVKLAE